MGWRAAREDETQVVAGPHGSAVTKAGVMVGWYSFSVSKPQARPRLSRHRAAQMPPSSPVFGGPAPSPLVSAARNGSCPDSRRSTCRRAQRCQRAGCHKVNYVLWLPLPRQKNVAVPPPRSGRRPPSSPLAALDGAWARSRAGHDCPPPARRTADAALQPSLAALGAAPADGRPETQLRRQDCRPRAGLDCGLEAG